MAVPGAFPSRVHYCRLRARIGKRRRGEKPFCASQPELGGLPRDMTWEPDRPEFKSWHHPGTGLWGRGPRGSGVDSMHPCDARRSARDVIQKQEAWLPSAHRWLPCSPHNGPKPTPPFRAPAPSASPSTRAPGSPMNRQLRATSGGSQRPSTSHKTAANLGRPAHPPLGRAAGMESLVLRALFTPSRGSSRAVSALLQNSTGEGPAPLSRLVPTQESPLRAKHIGAGGMALKCRLGRTCRCAQKANGGGEGGAEVVQCTTRSCLPSLTNAWGWWSMGRPQGGCPAAGPTQLPGSQSPCPLPSQTPRQKPFQTTQQPFS